ncbi:MAG: hypothetical protein A3J38_00010 [Gammaproteobacteria bacterium RIFCSPHIGHO2_12_FULL_45_9]|nr:MAG: hypothetical protein A3J38_00010 [Gammaproteobacteria bacterium RIFCSPHIGHO2_12_FULL_45_9]
METDFQFMSYHVRRSFFFTLGCLFLHAANAAPIYTDEFAPVPIMATSTPTGNAFTPSDPDLRMDTIDQNWNIFAGLGYMASLDATKNVQFQATADPYHEEDLLSDPKQSTHLQYLIGLQRVFLIQNSLIQRFDIGPTIFYDPVTFSGQVYQYTVPTLDNYDYRYRVEPINFDIEGQILFRRHGNPHKVGVAPYLLAGLGVSYVNLHYDETALGSTPSNTAYSFSDHAVRPVLIAGIGLQFDVLFKFFIRTDYRYLFRGDAKLHNSVFYSPVTVNLDTQSANLLFGYRFS